MAYEAAGCATLCREVSHQHKATRGTSQQGQASLADHLSCLDCSAASAASPSVIARRAFDKKCSPGTAGKWLLGGISMFIKKNTAEPKYLQEQNDSRPSWSPQGWRNRLDSPESNSMAMGKR